MPEKDKRFRATVDFEDGSAEGVHFTSDGSEEAVTQAVQKRVPHAHFEEQEDGKILIFETEAAAEGKHAKSIGTVEVTFEN